MKHLIKIIVLLFVLLISKPLIKAQECFLKHNDLEAILILESYGNNNDSIVKANFSIKNNSSKKIYLPKINTNSFEYHFFYKNKTVYSYLGIKQNFWGAMNLGSLVRINELLPGEIFSFSVDIPKEKKEDIQEIIYMFEYYPDNKSNRKKIKIFEGEKIIKGTDYWDNCQNIFSLIKMPMKK